MIKLSELPYGIEIPLDDRKLTMPNPNNEQPKNKCKNTADGKWPDYELITLIEKTRDKSKNCDIYSIKIRRLNKSVHRVLAYMYFTHELGSKKASFIGVKTDNRIRKSGFSSYLISKWIELCLANDIEDLCTTQGQRKPIPIYSLKKMTFELGDKNLYGKGHNIYICKHIKTGQKALYFENYEDRRAFEASKINKETPHIILPKMVPAFEQITPVVLENPYFVQNVDEASNLSAENIELFPDKIRK